jgi:hypothetical protein
MLNQLSSFLTLLCPQKKIVFLMSFVIGAMIVAKFLMGENEIQGKTNHG